MLPVYHHWRFKAGAGGDFRTLAARLRTLSEAVDLGRAPLDYPRVDPPVELQIRGALSAVGASDAPAPPDVTADAAALTTPLNDPRGRPVVSAPVYGAAWRNNPLTTGWGSDANRDPATAARRVSAPGPGSSCKRPWSMRSASRSARSTSPRSACASL